MPITTDPNHSIVAYSYYKSIKKQPYMRKRACGYAGLQSFSLLHLTRYKVKLKHWHKTDLPQYTVTSTGIRVIRPSSVSKGLLCHQEHIRTGGLSKSV